MNLTGKPKPCKAEMLQTCLMAMACTLPPITDPSAPSSRHAQELVELLSQVALEIDGLSIHLFGALCEGCDCPLRSTLEGLMTCLLLCISRANRSIISSETILELVHGDVLWASMLAKGVLCCTDRDDYSMLMAEDLQILATRVLHAVLCLHKPHLAFLRENTFSSNAISIDARHAVLRQHRIEVASAFAHSGLEPILLSKCGGLLPQLVSYLAYVAAPDSVVLEYTEQFWELLFSGFGEGSQTYRADCAVVSIANPPTHEQCERNLCTPSQWICDGDPADSLSVVCVLAARGGIQLFEPVGRHLQDFIRSLRAEGLADFRVALERWRDLGCDGLTLWLAFTDSLLQEADEPALQQPHSQHENAPDAARQGQPGLHHLRHFFSDTPQHLCCSLDGHLMLDPVRSPAGHLFERSNLVRALQESGRCPVTSLPLDFAECRRSPRLRTEVLRWVRAQNQANMPE